MGQSPARREPGRPRTDGLDQGILEATLRVMARDGYARMSLDSVARDAGTTRTSIYRRHKTKAELATAALAYLRTRSPQTETGDLREELVAELSSYAAGVGRPYGMTMVGVVLAEEHHTPDLLDLYRRQTVVPRRENVRRILARAADRGELRGDADVEVLITMLIGSYYAWYLDHGMAADDWASRVVDAVLSALLDPRELSRRQ